MRWPPASRAATPTRPPLTAELSVSSVSWDALQPAAAEVLASHAAWQEVACTEVVRLFVSVSARVCACRLGLPCALVEQCSTCVVEQLVPWSASLAACQGGAHAVQSAHDHF